MKTQMKMSLKKIKEKKGCFNMKVKEFVEKSNMVANDAIKASRISSYLKVKPYVNFLDKVALANRVVKRSVYDLDENGIPVSINVKSDVKYLLHVMGMIELYTDLEVNYENILEDYDLLNQSGLLVEIVKLIGDKEVGECQMLLDMKFADEMQNKLSTEAFISNQVDRFGVLAGTVLSPILESFTTAINNLTPEQTEKVRNLFEDKKSENNDFKEVNDGE